MVNSMTAFASSAGEQDGTRWVVEIRSVNGRGLDIRPRLPEGCDGLEAVLKSEIAKYCKRGNVNATVKLHRTHVGGLPSLNPAALDAAIQATKQAMMAAKTEGLDVAPLQVSELLRLQGVFEASHDTQGAEVVCLPAIKQAVVALVGEFAQARAAEGAALHRILTDQIDQIDSLHGAALGVLGARLEKTESGFRANVAKVLANSDGVDAQRLAQELAILTVKSDVTEELDRLGAHIAAARTLLGEDGAIGRKFDFLTQEFNREANTLCSKSNYPELTRIGLDLKTVIDQMREQVQNVE